MLQKKKITVKQMSTVAMMTAITCILAPISIAIPISPVPISFTTLAVCLTLYVLGMKWGTVSYILYLLIGLAGVPVLSGFTGGPGKLFGPTGGYMIGFIFMCTVTGWIIDRFSNKRLLCFLGMVLGMAICYLFGTLWLSYQADMNLHAAFAAAVLPFIPADLIKIICILLIGPEIRKALVKAGLIR